ncbi:MAG: hypothetical protein ABIA63_13860, partial [bacterium]
ILGNSGSSPPAGIGKIFPDSQKIIKIPRDSFKISREAEKKVDRWIESVISEQIEKKAEIRKDIHNPVKNQRRFLCG